MFIFFWAGVLDVWQAAVILIRKEKALRTLRTPVQLTHPLTVVLGILHQSNLDQISNTLQCFHFDWFLSDVPHAGMTGLLIRWALHRTLLLRAFRGLSLHQTVFRSKWWWAICHVYDLNAACSSNVTEARVTAWLDLSRTDQSLLV